MEGQKVGISKFVVTRPKFAIKPDALSEAIGESEGKIQALLNDKRILPDAKPEVPRPGYSESNITFSADAAYKFFTMLKEDKEALKRFIANPPRAIYTGTESNSDRSKPDFIIAMHMALSKLWYDDRKYFTEINNIIHNALYYPMTFACSGGTLALEQATKEAERNGSAIFWTADTSIYSQSSAKITQGAACAFGWIEKDPKLLEVEIKRGVFGYNYSENGFTKVGYLPELYPFLSQISYMYDVGKALLKLEESNLGLSQDCSFVIPHTPLMRQVMQFITFMYVHKLKDYMPEEYKKLQENPCVGPSPINGEHITQIMERKFEYVNEHEMTEKQISEMFENDSELSAVFAWIDKVRKNDPGFVEFLNEKNMAAVLSLIQRFNNSYACSALVGVAGVVDSYARFIDMPKGISEEEKNKILEGILYSFGSGSQAIMTALKIVATGEEVNKHFYVDNDGAGAYLNAAAYTKLHAELEDENRMVTDSNLVEKDMELLRELRDSTHDEDAKLKDGFRIMGRDIKGNTDWGYVENGKFKQLFFKY